MTQRQALDERLADLIDTPSRGDLLIFGDHLASQRVIRDALQVRVDRDNRPTPPFGEVLLVRRNIQDSAAWKGQPLVRRDTSGAALHGSPTLELLLIRDSAAYTDRLILITDRLAEQMMPIKVMSEPEATVARWRAVQSAASEPHVTAIHTLDPTHPALGWPLDMPCWGTRIYLDGTDTAILVSNDGEVEVLTDRGGVPGGPDVWADLFLSDPGRAESADLLDQVATLLDRFSGTVQQRAGFSNAQTVGSALYVITTPKHTSPRARRLLTDLRWSLRTTDGLVAGLERHARVIPSAALQDFRDLESEADVDPSRQAAGLWAVAGAMRASSPRGVRA